jgi:type I restriction enzyme S subunit
VGVIPEDWDVKQLGTLVTYTNGKAHEQSISNSGRYVVANSKFISSEGETRKYSEHCFCPTLKGDVLMVMSDVPNGRAIAKCYWVERDKTYTVNQRICALTPQGIDGKLLFYKLDRNPFYLAFDDGAKQTNLRKDEVLACPLGIPKSCDEQRAIAGALSDVNALIGRLNQLIAKKRDIKQAAMQQLLTAETRLPGFHGEWEVKRLREFAALNRLNVIPAGFPDQMFVHFSLPAFDDGKVPVVEPGAAIGSNKFRIPQGAVLVSKLNPRIPRVWSPEEIPEEAIASTEFLVLTPRGGFSRRFLYVTCSSPSFCEQMELAATGTTGSHQRISPGVALSLKVSVPVDIAEQAAIAEVLSDMDAELAALGQRLTKTDALKEAMRQTLLTGRTRLV